VRHSAANALSAAIAKTFATLVSAQIQLRLPSATLLSLTCQGSDPY
jgi:hypothetical protein